MTKKYYRIDIEVVSTAWETCECYVQAESEEEARRIFTNDPDVGDWDNWNTHDSEIRNWEVERVEYDEWMTKHMSNPNRLNGCEIKWGGDKGQETKDEV